MIDTQEAVMEAVPIRRDAAVEVHELRKVFTMRDRKKGRFGKRTRTALDGVTFSMERGETVAILGQNGSGKSTLVRLLSTLLLPDGGTRPHPRPRRRRRASRRAPGREPRVGGGIVLQEDVGRREPELRGALLRHDRRSDPRQDPRDPPAGRASRRIAATSRWRISRAGCSRRSRSRRALLTSPVVLLLDEPTTGLDPRSKLEVQDFIREIRVSHDSTILLCTHDLAEAEILAERVGILDRGRLLTLEPAEELKLRYGCGTLEEAFFKATGREFEAEEDEEDDREVMA